MATCLFRDGPHVCGEPSVSEVGLAPAPGAPGRVVSVCEKHRDLVDDVYERSGGEPIAHQTPPAMPGAENPAPAASTEESSPQMVEIHTGDSVGAGERT